jgi:thiol:disulfide interchange protein
MNIMMTRTVQSLLLALLGALSVQAFAPVTFSRSRIGVPLEAVVDVDSEAAFDQTIKSAGSSLVVIDYSTTWCGPCKVRS